MHEGQRIRTMGHRVGRCVARLGVASSATLLAAALLSLHASPAGAGRIGSDPYALLSVDGRQVAATGPIDCADYPNEHPQYRVTLTQPSTGAMAEQRWDRACTDALQQSGWTVTLLDARGAAFQPGDAELVVLDYDSTHQWINQVQLVTTLPTPTPSGQ